MTSQPYWAYGTSTDAGPILYKDQPIQQQPLKDSQPKNDEKPYVPEGYQPKGQEKKETKKEATKEEDLPDLTPKEHTFLHNKDVNRQASDYFVPLNKQDEDSIALLNQGEKAYA